jgi:hypothetical protein
MGYGSNEFNVPSPTVMESAGFTPGLGLHSLPGVRFITWTPYWLSSTGVLTHNNNVSDKCHSRVSEWFQGTYSLAFIN